MTRNIAKAYSCCENYSKVVEILEPLVDRHYGYLPSIATVLCDAYIELNAADKAFPVFQKTSKCIERGLYNPACFVGSFYVVFTNNLVQNMSDSQAEDMGIETIANL